MTYDASELWAALDRLVDRAPSLADLRAHRLHFYAAIRWRSLGRPVPPSVEEEQRVAEVFEIAVPFVLERVREALDGPVLLVKGPEAASFYPQPLVRVYRDLDLLVSDAKAAQRALLAAGFVEVGDPDIFIDIHHERPLWLPGSPRLAIELHSRPKWPERFTAPALDELFATAVQSATGVPGLQAASAAHHALLLAAHSWSHVPLGRLLDLVDVAMVSDGVKRAEMAKIARSWGVERIWRTTIGACDALFFGGEATWALRGWAWNLADARERSVFGSHVQAWLSPFSALPPAAAVRASGRALLGELEPGEGETWDDKLRRTRLAIRNAFVRRSEHAEQLGPAAHRRRRRPRA